MVFEIISFAIFMCEWIIKFFVIYHRNNFYSVRIVNIRKIMLLDKKRETKFLFLEMSPPPIEKFLTTNLNLMTM